MKLIFENKSSIKPLVSIILLDWSCRESFHSLHYLNNQIVPRDQYEIIWIEFYSRCSPEIEARLKESERLHEPPVVDKWIVMDMPANVYYHKHLMYNIGIIMSKGNIVVICDSDAMVTENFIKTIIDTFEENDKIVLHLDEFRNTRRDFYPFNYPSFEEVVGEGCINNANGKTTGVIDVKDPLHTRNYGACMCARRSDLIAIGGADEHINYLGHVCGPYEMTFRLVNYGCREIWHESEFLYHTWHLGQAGEDNYVGPHDGKHMSTTALESLTSGRIMPLVENKAVKLLRIGVIYKHELLEYKLINPSYINSWKYEFIATNPKFNRWFNPELLGSDRGYNIVKYGDRIYGVPQSLGQLNFNNEEQRNHPAIFSAQKQQEIKKKIKENLKKVHRWSYPELLGLYKGYNILKYGNLIYGVPQSVGVLDLKRKEHRNHPAIFSAKTQQEIEKLINNDEMVAVEYAGWLPVYTKFGNCGSHPQFAHLESPPIGYKFVRSHFASPQNVRLTVDGIYVKLIKLYRFSNFLVPIAKSVFSSLRNGAKLQHVIRFLRTRDLSSQLLLPRKLDLIFLPSVPYTYGQHPWMIEIEDTTSLFFPFEHNGRTSSIKLSDLPYLPIIKALLQSKRCKGIITHVKSTANSIPKLFCDDKLADKVTYIPLGIKPSPKGLQEKIESNYVDILFTNSWHQDPISFFSRGGLDLIEAFAILNKKYSNLRLTLRTKLPSELDPRYKLEYLFSWDKIPGNDNVRLIEFLKQNYSIDWVKTAKIEKIEDGRIIKLSTEKNSLSLRLNDEKTKVSLKIDDVRTDELIAEMENSKLNIYKFDTRYKLDTRYIEIIKTCNVRIIDGFLTNSEWQQLLSQSNIYVLPSARIHVVSILEAMSYGLAVVVSDGWGTEEYVENGKNALVVKGRYGKTSWMDSENGILRENYTSLFKIDPVVVEGLVHALSALIEDKGLRERLGKKARQDVETKYNIENWNKGLKEAFDKALNKKF